MSTSALPYHSQFAATVWPSMDFTINSVFRQQKPEAATFQHYDIIREAASYLYAIAGDTDGLKPQHSEYGLEQAAIKLERIRQVAPTAWQKAVDLVAGHTTPSALGLSVVSNSQKKSRRVSRRGLNGITPYGRKMVRSIVAGMSKRYDRRTLCFGTATVPPLTVEARIQLADNWPELCRHFMQWIKNQLKILALTPDVVIISEIQEKRLSATGEAYPHLHWLAPGRRDRFSDEWAIDPKKIDKYWGKLIARFSGQKVIVSSACKLEVPRTDPKKELGKYMSKGGRLIQKAAENGQARFLPRAWWQAPLALRREVKSRIVKLGANLAYKLRVGLDKLAELGIAKGRVILSRSDESQDQMQCELGAVGYFLGDDGLALFLTYADALDDATIAPSSNEIPKTWSHALGGLNTVANFNAIASKTRDKSA